MQMLISLGFHFAHVREVLHKLILLNLFCIDKFSDGKMFIGVEVIEVILSH